MPQLHMASGLPNLSPAIADKDGEDFAAAHRVCMYTYAAFCQGKAPALADQTAPPRPPGFGKLGCGDVQPARQIGHGIKCTIHRTVMT